MGGCDLSVTLKCMLLICCNSMRMGERIFLYRREGWSILRCVLSRRSELRSEVNFWLELVWIG